MEFIWFVGSRVWFWVGVIVTTVITCILIRQAPKSYLREHGSWRDDKELGYNWTEEELDNIGEE
jgi:hypothetical protein